MIRRRETWLQVPPRSSFSPHFDSLKEIWKKSGYQAGLHVVMRVLGAMQAIWNGTVLAESADTILVEGNVYFPSDSVRAGVLTVSMTHSLCPWKGVASYYDVNSRGSVNHDAAWTYRHPSPLARKIKGRVGEPSGVICQSHGTATSVVSSLGPPRVHIGRPPR